MNLDVNMQRHKMKSMNGLPKNELKNLKDNRGVVKLTRKEH